MTDREKEEELYLQAKQEIEDDNTDEATWTKAFAKSEGFEERTKALYIKYRVEKLKDEEISSPVVDVDDSDMTTGIWLGVILTIVAVVILFGIWKLLQVFGIIG